MITSIQRIDAGVGSRAFTTDRPDGFTLVEVMISAALSAIILAGVMSAFLMMTRTGMLAGAYSEMDAQTRRGLATLGEDVRRASDIHWNGNQSVTLTMVTGAGASQITYAYDSDPTSSTSGSFYSMSGAAGSGAAKTVLIRGVASDFTFARFKLVQPGVADDTASSDLETKRLQVTLRTARLGVTMNSATQSAVSASYILRNKRVTN